MPNIFRLPTRKRRRSSYSRKKFVSFGNAQPRVFTPTRAHAQKQLASQLTYAGLLTLIVVFTLLIFNKYLKTPLVQSITNQLFPKSMVVKENFAAKVVEKIDPAYFSVFEFNTDQRGDAIIKSEDNMVAQFSKDKEISSQVYSLQTVISQARIKDKKLKRIDLRFDKVYVEYQ